MKRVISGIWLIFPTLTFAQVQIDSSEIPQAIGTCWTTNSVASDSLNVGSAGGPHLWDFTGQVHRGDSSLSTIIDKQNGLFCDSFPSANLAQMDISLPAYSDTSYEYGRLIKDSLEIVGAFQYVNVNGNLSRYFVRLNPSFRIPLPISYGNQWTSFYQIKTTVQGYNVTVKNYERCTVDGYGQVQLDCGAFNNCLRILVYDTTITSVPPVYYDTSRTIIYEFWAENYGQIVAISSNRDETNPDFTSGNIAFMTSFQGGVEENVNYKMQNTKLEVYPNPCFSNVLIKYELTQEATTALNLYDISGRLVKTLCSSIQGKGYHQIDIKENELAKGVYFLKFSTGNYKTTRKLTILR